MVIEAGKVKELVPPQSEIHKHRNFDKIFDATGKYVMPGGIDPHVHLELKFMGTVSADDFNHGSRAAVAGGTTTFMDFIFPEG